MKEDVEFLKQYSNYNSKSPKERTRQRKKDTETYLHIHLFFQAVRSYLDKNFSDRTNPPKELSSDFLANAKNIESESEGRIFLLEIRNWVQENITPTILWHNYLEWELDKVESNIKQQRWTGDGALDGMEFRFLDAEEEGVDVGEFRARCDSLRKEYEKIPVPEYIARLFRERSSRLR